MKKQIKYIALVFIGIMGLSCEPDKVTEGISDITYFPEFDYQGDEVILSTCGIPFAEPGVTASENGASIPVTQKISTLLSGESPSTVPTTADRYTINYTAVNKDGYPAEASRTIWTACAGDLETSVEGLYTSTVFRSGVSGPQYTNMKYILIRKVAGSANKFEISDAIGGWYQLGRALGDEYRAPGLIITADGAGGFTLSGSPVVGGFGGAVTPKSITVDKAAKTVVITTSWDAGGGTVYEFVATMKQVSI